MKRTPLKRKAKLKAKTPLKNKKKLESRTQMKAKKPINKISANNKVRKETDISQEVKKIVFERDEGACVVCGNKQNVMPNAHYISRSKGGLGIEQNVVTLCTLLTPNKCHHKFDNGTLEEHAFAKGAIEKHLKKKYPDWNPQKLIYKK